MWRCVIVAAMYREIREAVRSATDMYPNMSFVDTPLVHGETRNSPHRRPASDEDCYECPTCLDTLLESYMKEPCHLRLMRPAS